MLTQKVYLRGFVGCGGHSCCSVEKANLQGEQIAENAADGHNRVNAGAAEFLERNEFHIGNFAELIGFGACA